jgi:hypothetical protein
MADNTKITPRIAHHVIRSLVPARAVPVLLDSLGVLLVLGAAVGSLLAVDIHLRLAMLYAAIVIKDTIRVRMLLAESSHPM